MHVQMRSRALVQLDATECVDVVESKLEKRYRKPVNSKCDKHSYIESACSACRLVSEAQVDIGGNSPLTVTRIRVLKLD